MDDNSVRGRGDPSTPSLPATSLPASSNAGLLLPTLEHEPSSTATDPSSRQTQHVNSTANAESVTQTTDEMSSPPVKLPSGTRHPLVFYENKLWPSTARLEDVETVVVADWPGWCHLAYLILEPSRHNSDAPLPSSWFRESNLFPKIHTFMFTANALRLVCEGVSELAPLPGPPVPRSEWVRRLVEKDKSRLLDQRALAAGQAARPGYLPFSVLSNILTITAFGLRPQTIRYGLATGEKSAIDSDAPGPEEAASHGRTRDANPRIAQITNTILNCLASAWEPLEVIADDPETPFLTVGNTPLHRYILSPPPNDLRVRETTVCLGSRRLASGPSRSLIIVENPGWGSTHVKWLAEDERAGGSNHLHRAAGSGEEYGIYANEECWMYSKETVIFSSGVLSADMLEEILQEHLPEKRYHVMNDPTMLIYVSDPSHSQLPTVPVRLLDSVDVAFFTGQDQDPASIV